ncbi:hypothetical protein TNCV_1870631 [Trichonephila clavipes]|nr:hypothetical protein TNCV_1870631 [Trichonephila clavipes]
MEGKWSWSKANGQCCFRRMSSSPGGRVCSWSWSRNDGQRCPVVGSNRGASKNPPGGVRSFLSLDPGSEIRGPSPIAFRSLFVALNSWGSIDPLRHSASNFRAALKGDISK